MFNDGTHSVNTKISLFKLSLCARAVGNPAVPYSRPKGVIHSSQVAREYLIVPHDSKPSRTFPAVGNAPHPQIRNIDISECRGCRKTGGINVNLQFSYD